MTAGFTIRRARPEDHPAVARELAEYLAYIGDRLDADGLDHDIAHWQAEYDGRSGVLLLVLDATAAVVGTAAVRVLEPGVGELKRMWLRPVCQGQGLGRRLLDASLAEILRFGGTAPQSNTTSSPLARGDSMWIDCATTSLPVPVSPSMTTVVAVGAIFSMIE